MILEGGLGESSLYYRRREEFPAIFLLEYSMTTRYNG